MCKQQTRSDCFYFYGFNARLNTFIEFQWGKTFSDLTAGVSVIGDKKNYTTNDFCYWLHLRNDVLHPITVIMLTNKSVVVLVWIKNMESAVLETETRVSQTRLIPR